MLDISQETARKLLRVGKHGSSDDREEFRKKDGSRYRDETLTISFTGFSESNSMPCPKQLRKVFAERGMNYDAIMAFDLPHNTFWSRLNEGSTEGKHSVSFPLNTVKNIANPHQSAEESRAAGRSAGQAR